MLAHYARYIMSAGEYRRLLALRLFGVVRSSSFVVRRSFHSSLAVKHENRKRRCMIFVFHRRIVNPAQKRLFLSLTHNSQTHHLLLPSTAQTKLIFLLPTYWICTSSLNFTSLLFLSRRSTLGAPAVGPRQQLLVDPHLLRSPVVW